MAIAIFPKRWASKPQLGVQINRGHPLAVSLVGYWLFNETGGNIIYDLVGGAHATLAGGSRVFNVDNLAVLFNGSSDLATVSNSSAAFVFGTNDFTLEVLGYFSSTGPFLTKDNSGNRGWELRIAAGFISFFDVNGGPTLTGNIVISGTTRNHIILTRDANGLTNYVNGVFDSFWSGAAFNHATTANIEFGGTDAGAWCNCGLAMVRIWNGRALKPSEITQLYIDPYCLLQPQSPQDRFWSTNVSGVAGSTLTLEWQGLDIH